MFIVRLVRVSTSDHAEKDITEVFYSQRINAVYSLSRQCDSEAIGPEARQLAAGLKWSPEVLAENLQIGLQPKADFHPDRIIPRYSVWLSCLIVN
jgi:hypothetical protein